jgi:hypothetical protein
VTRPNKVHVKLASKKEDDPVGEYHSVTGEVTKLLSLTVSVEQDNTVRATPTADYSQDNGMLA